MNNRRPRTLMATAILIALSLTGIAAFAMTHRVIANGSRTITNEPRPVTDSPTPVTKNAGSSEVLMGY